jgi:hypothetical protein
LTVHAEIDGFWSDFMWLARSVRPSFLSCAANALRAATNSGTNRKRASMSTSKGNIAETFGFRAVGRDLLSLAKAFALGGARNIELRWDIFSVFNSVNYALPNNVIGSATTDFGKITDSVGGPRVMQVGARFRF